VNGGELELAEAAAYESLFAGAGLPTARIAGAACLALPQVPEETALNRVTGLGLAGPVADAELDEVDAFFRPHGVRWAVGVSPHAPGSLAASLRERGFTEGYAWMKFGRALDPPPTAVSRLQVRRVDDGDAFGNVVARAYGLPEQLGPGMFAQLPGCAGWHCFVAFDGDEPAGAAALFAHGDVGWLGVAGTAPEHRSKGAQGALFAARIQTARELGLRALTTETGERTPGRPGASYRNILRAGFDELYLRPNLVQPG
jgi:GNAT superfamily N-acetyltransferase